MLQTVTHGVGERARGILRIFLKAGLSRKETVPGFDRKTRIDTRLFNNQFEGWPRKMLGGGIGLPLYEYRCTSCGYGFEKIQSFSAEPERVCPKCQGELIRPVTAPALRFEGAGWYVNDYAGKGGKKAEPAAGAASPEGAKDAKTESKAESKTGASDGGSSAAASTPAAPAGAASSTPAASSSSSN
jgi:putative FmdB family regulatory protein